MGDEGGEVDEGGQGMTTRALELLKINFMKKFHKMGFSESLLLLKFRKYS